MRTLTLIGIVIMLSPAHTWMMGISAPIRKLSRRIGHGGRFVPFDLSGEVVGNYATLFDARAALLQARC
jgi:hypothetical protein